jgi:hypothetical protein
MGCSIKSTKVFCDKSGNVTEVPIVENFPPDPTSMIFWLKNRQPAKWRDKHDMEHSGAIEFKPTKIFRGKPT